VAPLRERDTAGDGGSNVDIARRLMEAFVGGDPATVFALLDPEIEFRPPPEHPDFAVYRGREGITRAFDQWNATWESLEYDEPEYIDAGQRVLVASRQRGKAKGSGAEVASEFFNVFTLHAGKVVRFDMFYDRRDALEAAGLSADTDSSG
jgi:ketosteroid isomerase-like protein